MLYLHSASSVADASPERTPVAELTAIGLERALIAADVATRRQELAKVLARDPAMVNWATNAAERGLERPVRSVEETAAWLADHLEQEIAAALANEADAADSDVSKRLPKLAARLAAYETRLSNFDARLQHEKLEAMKELAYGAGHEINNPLANIAARAQTLLQDEKDMERSRKLTAIHRQAMRAHEMIADLMLFARPPKLNLEICEIEPIVRRVVDGLAHVAEERHAHITFDFAARPIQVRCDATQLGVAVHAVVINSLEAIDDGGRVDVELRETHDDGQPYAAISVRDNGPGISEEVRRRMFDPFFSGREAGRGLGFGLSKCWRIVTDHGGRIRVGETARNGALVVISIPLADDAE